MRLDALRIVGGSPLSGTVKIGGAKNSALPCIFASLLSSENIRLRRVPKLGDVETACQIMSELGRHVSRRGGNCTFGGGTKKHCVPAHLARAMRASVLTLGPLLATTGRAQVPLPGGCDIGSRPIGIHLAGLAAMGATIDTSGGIVTAKVVGRLRGARITLECPSFTGTENLLMAACLARGETILENAAREPEISDLAAMLISMGAIIRGAGTQTIQVQGSDSLSGGKHTVMPDRIETGTFLAAVAAVGGKVLLEGASGAHLGTVLKNLAAMGANISQESSGLLVHMNAPPEAASFETAPYPGFPTDLQAQMMAANCIASGKALIVEHVFERRFRHADELGLLGADIKVHGNCAVVNGVPRLKGATVQATDLRASASLVIGGMVASGVTVLRGLHHLSRGYADLPAKLRGIGVRISKCR